MIDGSLDRDRARIKELEDKNQQLEETNEALHRELVCTTQGAEIAARRLSETQSGLRQRVAASNALRERVDELEIEVGAAQRSGWEEAFRMIDPVFQRIESALHCSEAADFMTLMGAAIEEYAKLVPDFVLDERDYLTAAQTAGRLRIGRDRLRDIPRSDLDYVVRGEGRKKEHRRYAKAEVLKYSARLVRGERGGNR